MKLWTDHQLVRRAYVGKVIKKGDGMAFDVVAKVPGAKIHQTSDPPCKL